MTGNYFLIWSIRLNLISDVMMKKVSLIFFLFLFQLIAEKPNILFIMSDDHAAHAIGVYGGRLATLNPTPALDDLAEGGMRFDKVFCNNAICTPSRASIITGQYSQTNGVLDLKGSISSKKQYLPGNEETGLRNGSYRQVASKR